MAPQGVSDALRAGLTRILMFHHISQLPSRFCQIPISPSKIGQTMEIPKSKSIQGIDQ